MKSPALFLSLVAIASGQTTPVAISPEATRVQIQTGKGSPFLRVNDPGNHRWMVQSSTDLSTWSDGPSYRVFNGELIVPLPPRDGSSRKYYRLNSDLAASVPSTKARVLRMETQPAEQPLNYDSPDLPVHIEQMLAFTGDPRGNTTTSEGALLGRVLFYDKRLSLNQSVSCASCHQPEHGWSDPRARSVGFDGQLTRRNSMGLTNLKFSYDNKFFRDDRAIGLEQAVLLPIQDPIEMGMTLDQAVQRLAAEPYYVELFTDAFGTPEINATRISYALSQFLRTIVSTKSKWDQGVPVNFANFTAQEKEGKAIFESKCMSCHDGDHLSGVAGNNGLEFPFLDKGIGEINPGPTRDGKFHQSSLRNVGLTAPYMHDGRFQTLEEVVEFYNSGINSTPTLSKFLQPFAKPNGMNLTEGQKAALVAFLKTLSDPSIPADSPILDPFRYEEK